MRPVLDQSRGKIASNLIGAHDENSNVNKIGFREVFEHFNAPFHKLGFAVDGSSRCIHDCKGFLVLSQVDGIKMKKSSRLSHDGNYRASK